MDVILKQIHVCRRDIIRMKKKLIFFAILPVYLFVILNVIVMKCNVINFKRSKIFIG